MNQIERIMAVLPQPSRQEIESLGAPYAMAILGQLPRRSLSFSLSPSLQAMIICVKFLNNGHIGNGHFVLYREVVLSSEVNVLV